MPAAAKLADGSSVVVFEQFEESNWERVDSAGQLQRSFNSVVQGNAAFSPWLSVQANPDGGFSAAYDDNSGALYEATFNAAGQLVSRQPLSTPFAPAPVAFTSDVSAPAPGGKLADLSDGGWVKAYVGSDSALHVQAYNHQGQAILGKHVSANSSGGAYTVAGVTPLAEGGYAVAYTLSSPQGASLWVQAYGANGAYQQENSLHFAGSIQGVAISGLAGRDFVVAWSETASSGGTVEWAMEMDSRGQAVATWNLGAADAGQPSRIVALPDGHFTVAWTQNGAIQQQVLAEHGPTFQYTSDQVFSFDPHYTMPDGPHVLFLTSDAGQTVTGNARDDVIWANQENSGNATIDGGAGADTLHAGYGTTVLTGGAGNDVFALDTATTPTGATYHTEVTDFTQGADKIDASRWLNAAHYTGYDPIGDGYLKFSSDGAGGTRVLVDLHDGGGPVLLGTLDHVDPGQLKLSDFAGYTGSSETASDHHLIGGSGADTLTAGRGPDTLTGNGGADHFVFNVLPTQPNEVTDFAPGTDKLDFSALLSASGYGGSNPVADGYVKFVDSGSGSTWVYYDTDGKGTSDQWGTYVTVLDHVTPGQLTVNDLVGSWSAGTGGTGGGGDTTSGGGGDTTGGGSTGGSGGSGQAIGETSGGQQLTGGAGDDTLTVLHGGDTVTGGGGADHFAFSSTPPWSSSEFTDFTHGTDKIDVSALLSASHYSGADPVADGYVKFLDNGSGGTWVYYDTDGHGSGDPWGTFIATLDHVSPGSLSVADLTTGASSGGRSTGGGGSMGGGGSTGGGSTSSGQAIGETGGGEHLTGGSGDDTLTVIYGNDTLTGAGGADRFAFSRLPWNPSEITDFTHGTDRIDVSALDRSSGYTGSNVLADGYVRLIDNGSGGTWVYYDTDGPGSADQWGTFIATLDHVAPSALSANDFVV